MENKIYKLTENELSEIIQKACEEGMLIQRSINDKYDIPAIRIKKYIDKILNTEPSDFSVIDKKPTKEELKETTFLERLIKEEKELSEKIVGLNKELQSDFFVLKVGLKQFELLNLQHGAMITYKRILIMRINDLKNSQA